YGEPPRFLGMMPELAGQLTAAGTGLGKTAGAGGAFGTVLPLAGSTPGRAGGLPGGLGLLGGGGFLLLRRRDRPGFPFALPQVLLVLALLSLPLEGLVCLRLQLLGGGAVLLRVPGGELLHQGGGQAHV